MNPPTFGHAIMLQEGLKLAKRENADYKIYLSKTQDPKKNPLPYEIKADFFKKMFPQYAQNFVEDKNLKTAIDILKSLDGQYSKAVMLVGDDRIEDFQKLLSTYNGKEYNYNQILVQSTGERVTGRSATAMRAFVTNDDLQGFISAYKEAFPSMNEQLIQNLFEAIKSGMATAKPKKIKESEIQMVFNILREMSSAGGGNVEGTVLSNKTQKKQVAPTVTYSDKDIISIVNKRLKELENE
jgi:hypothetical protein